MKIKDHQTDKPAVTDGNARLIGCKCHINRALKTKENRRPQSQRPQMPPVASKVVAMTTNGDDKAPGDDKAVQPAIPCFQFEKKKYSNNMVEKVLLYISVMRISQ